MSLSFLLAKGISLLVLLLWIWRRREARESPEFSRPRRDGLVALGFVLVGLLWVGFQTSRVIGSSRSPAAGPADSRTLAPVPARASVPAEPPETHPDWYNEKWEGWTAQRALRQSRTYLLQLIPVALVLLLLRQGPWTVGLTLRNLRTALLLGLALGVIHVLAFGPPPLGRLPVLAGPPEEEAWFFLGAMVVVGFVEELTFRGLIQMRLVAWLGAVWGISVSVAFFTLVHLPRYLARGQDGTDLLLALSANLLSGIVYSLALHRTRNIVAPALPHALGNWAS